MLWDCAGSARTGTSQGASWRTGHAAWKPGGGADPGGAAGFRGGMLAAAERQAAGLRYQWARTLVLAGGPERVRGEDELAAMGAAPMAPG